MMYGHFLRIRYGDIVALHVLMITLDDQMLLLQSVWAELHVLDFTYQRVRNNLPDMILMDNGLKLKVASVALLALAEGSNEWERLCGQMLAISFDRYDYVAMKYLMLLNPESIGYSKLQNKRLVSEGREKVKAAWLEYRRHIFADASHHDTPLPFQNCIERTRSLGLRGEQYLYYKMLSGHIPKGLLTEMLISYGSRTRQASSEANMESQKRS
ncbi:unnamed protein product [Soboliphyme baturini]|uniref:NR LBD domain-containing protein n=1 Tax=Soboliphyme baturini TaxID=241478 RepID=A0A183J2W6_9BILA|nr:unnamed protein product [Soboliphyme baturini]